MWFLGLNLPAYPGNIYSEACGRNKEKMFAGMLPQHRPQEVFTEFFKAPFKKILQ